MDKIHLRDDWDLIKLILFILIFVHATLNVVHAQEKPESDEDSVESTTEDFEDASATEEEPEDAKNLTKPTKAKAKKNNNKSEATSEEIEEQVEFTDESEGTERLAKPAAPATPQVTEDLGAEEEEQFEDFVFDEQDSDESEEVEEETTPIQPKPKRPFAIPTGVAHKKIAEPTYKPSTSDESYPAVTLGHSYLEDLPENTPPVGSVLMNHPQARLGLTEITSKGTYIYKTTPSPQAYSSSVRVGAMAVPEIESATSGKTFAELYSASAKPIVFFDFEWQPFKSLGRVGLKLGSGVFTATGNGVFVIDNPARAGLVPREKFTFVMFPNSAAITYKPYFFRNQWIVPYGEAGVGYYVMGEFRDDGQPATGKWAGSATSHFAGGVSFLLDFLDRYGVLNLDREYGINHVYLTAEYRQLIGINKTYDFTSSIFSAGISVDY